MSDANTTTDASGGWRARLWADDPGLSGLASEPFPSLHGAVLAFAVVSGLIHLVEGLKFLLNSTGTDFTTMLGVSLVLSALGFFSGVVFVVVGFLRWWVYRIAVPFTGSQIVVWYLLNRPLDALDTLGIVDKLVQLAIIVGIVVILRRT